MPSARIFFNSLIYLYKLVNLLNKVKFIWWNICPGKLKVVFRHISRRANMYKKVTIQWNLCRRQTSFTLYSYVFVRKLTRKVILRASKWHKPSFSIFISLWVRADRLTNWDVQSHLTKETIKCIKNSFKPWETQYSIP